MTCFIHISNVIYFGSYLIRDLLWLRILTFLGLCCGVTYYVVRSEPLLAPACWQSAAAAINLIQIARMVRKRQVATDASVEAVVRTEVFDRLTSDETAALLMKARWGAETESAEACCRESIWW